MYVTRCYNEKLDFHCHRIEKSELSYYDRQHRNAEISPTPRYEGAGSPVFVFGQPGCSADDRAGGKVRIWRII